MKSLLSLLLTLALLFLGIGTCLVLWYQSSSTEFARKPGTTQAAGRH